MENINKNKKIYLIICGGVIIVCMIVAWFFDSKSSGDNYNYLELENVEKEAVNENSVSESEMIIVHIIGEVRNPGVVEIKEGARIKDVIEAAGGVTELADEGKVNLAYEVSDGQKIYIPSVSGDAGLGNELISGDSGDSVIVDGGDFGDESKININKATQTELESLSGIGPSIASKIIDYRVENGRFKSVDEIKNVSGIGEEKFVLIKDEICVK